MIIIKEEIKEKMISLYKEGKSLNEIAKILGYCKETIRRHLKKKGIKFFIGKSNAFMKIEDDLKQLLIGSLLGDGSFCSNGKHTKNYYLSIVHCIKQLEYLKYKVNILNKYNLASPIQLLQHRDERFKNPIYKECKEKSRLHPIFTNIREKYYDSTGHKRVHYEFVKDIEALGLAIWYMDDGYVTNNSCILSTCSFSLEEQKILSDVLLTKFNLHFNIGKNDNSMYLQARDFSKFVEIIKPYVIDSMKYKLIPYRKRVLYKSGELLEG